MSDVREFVREISTQLVADPLPATIEGAQGGSRQRDRITLDQVEQLFAADETSRSSSARPAVSSISISTRRRRSSPPRPAPATATFGRRSKRRGHYLYQVDGEVERRSSRSLAGKATRSRSSRAATRPSLPARSTRAASRSSGPTRSSRPGSPPTRSRDSRNGSTPPRSSPPTGSRAVATIARSRSLGPCCAPTGLAKRSRPSFSRSVEPLATTRPMTGYKRSGTRPSASRKARKRPAGRPSSTCSTPTSPSR